MAQNCEIFHWATSARALNKPVPCYGAMFLGLKLTWFSTNWYEIQNFWGPIDFTIYYRNGCRGKNKKDEECTKLKKDIKA